MLLRRSGELREAESLLQRANCWLASTTSGAMDSNNVLLVSLEITSRHRREVRYHGRETEC